MTTPKQAGYYFPAEFGRHAATWLSWPHKEASWPGKIATIYPAYGQFVRELTKGEVVCINVADEAMRAFATRHLQEAGVDLSKVRFFFIPPMMPGAGIMALLFWSTPMQWKKR